MKLRNLLASLSLIATLSFQNVATAQILTRDTRCVNNDKECYSYVIENTPIKLPEYSKINASHLQVIANKTLRNIFVGHELGDVVGFNEMNGAKNLMIYSSKGISQHYTIFKVTKENPNQIIMLRVSWICNYGMECDPKYRYEQFVGEFNVHNPFGFLGNENSPNVIYFR